jgi:NADH-quinone oxidoreductase subunit L
VLFDMAPVALATVGIIGGVTALFAATIGLVQNDIKRVLAYSTVSQLGYMFLACGVGAYTAAIFHLVTHAFFKALLFLSAGAVIHSLSGEQDIRKMGGLYKKIPITHIVFLIGTLAIAGIPPLAGFWSKDEIMAHAFVHGYYHLYLLAAIGAFLTSFYMFRLTYLTFYGQSRVEPHVAKHIHESPPVMTVPLMILAGLAVVGGFLGVPPEHGWFHGFLHDVATPLGAEPHAVAMNTLLSLMGVAVAIALGGWGLAHYMYSTRPQMANDWAEKSPQVYTTLLNKYYVDEFYDRFIVEPFKKLGMLWDWFDQHIIDRFVNGIGKGTDISAAAITWTEKHVIYAGLNVVGYGNHLLAWSWRKLQSGMVHHYAAILIIGLAVLIHLVVLWFTGSTLAGSSMY